MPGLRRWGYSLLGFATASTLTSALSIYVLFIGFFSQKIGVRVPTLILWGNLAYFIGMPVGKVIGRTLKFYKKLPLATAGLTAVISISLIMMPFVSTFSQLLALRIVQGTVTFYMEVFSNAYSFLFEEFKSRNLASSISISGIPGGVAIGTSAYALETQNPIAVYVSFGIISTALGILYSISTKRFRQIGINLAKEERGTTYRLKVTWLMGFYWATIAGFNLVLAVVLPPYISSYYPRDVPLAMETFGYSGAILTILGGIIAYITKSLKNMAVTVGIFYIVSFIGFMLLYLFEPVGLSLMVIIILIMLEGIAVPFIYSVPREIYPKSMVAKGTWEFALIGSSFHIWGALIILTIGSIFGYRLSIFALIFPPIYGAIVSFILPKISRKGSNNESRKVV